MINKHLSAQWLFHSWPSENWKFYLETKAIRLIVEKRQVFADTFSHEVAISGKGKAAEKHTIAQRRLARGQRMLDHGYALIEKGLVNCGR